MIFFSRMKFESDTIEIKMYYFLLLKTGSLYNAIQGI